MYKWQNRSIYNFIDTDIFKTGRLKKKYIYLITIQEVRGGCRTIKQRRRRYQAQHIFKIIIQVIQVIKHNYLQPRIYFCCNNLLLKIVHIFSYHNFCYHAALFCLFMTSSVIRKFIIIEYRKPLIFNIKPSKFYNVQIWINFSSNNILLYIWYATIYI